MMNNDPRQQARKRKDRANRSPQDKANRQRVIEMALASMISSDLQYEQEAE